MSYAPEFMKFVYDEFLFRCQLHELSSDEAMGFIRLAASCRLNDAYVRDQGGKIAAQRDVANILGVSERQGYRILRRLADAGMVYRGRGYFINPYICWHGRYGQRWGFFASMVNRVGHESQKLREVREEPVFRESGEPCGSRDTGLFPDFIHDISGQVDLSSDDRVPEGVGIYAE